MTESNAIVAFWLIDSCRRINSQNLFQAPAHLSPKVSQVLKFRSKLPLQEWPRQDKSVGAVDSVQAMCQEAVEI